MLKYFIYSQTCIKRSSLGQRKMGYKTDDVLKGSIHLKFSMTGQEKGDLAIQLAA